MKKLLFLLVCLPELLFCQTENLTAKRWEMGVFAAPHLNTTLARSSEELTKVKKIRAGWSSGCVFRYRVAGNFWLRSGGQINLEQFSQRNEIERYKKDAYNPIAIDEAVSEVNLNSKFLAVELPFLAEMRSSTGWFLGVGFSLQKVIAIQSTAEVNYFLPKSKPDLRVAPGDFQPNPIFSFNVILTGGYFFKTNNGVSAGVAPFLKLNNDELSPEAFPLGLSQMLSTGIQTQFTF